MYVYVDQLTFEYNQKTPVINDVSFTMKKGEIVALLGNSGSGKSTLLRLIAGLEQPNKGIIKVNQRVLNNAHISITPEHRSVGMVFQDYALFPHMTVEKNIAFGLHDIKKTERDMIIKSVLTLVKLEKKRHHYPHELSGGEQQRITLARSLAVNPDILLLDEPFSNLDARLKSNIRKELQTILKTAGTTCLFVTHDVDDAKAIADRIINIESGKII